MAGQEIDELLNTWLIKAGRERNVINRSDDGTTVQYNRGTDISKCVFVHGAWHPASNMITLIFRIIAAVTVRGLFFLPCGLFIRSAPFNICKTFPHHHTSNKERTMLEIEQITSKHCYIFKKIRNPLKHKLMS